MWQRKPGRTPAIATCRSSDATGRGRWRASSCRTHRRPRSCPNQPPDRKARQATCVPAPPGPFRATPALIQHRLRRCHMRTEEEQAKYQIFGGKVRVEALACHRAKQHSAVFQASSCAALAPAVLLPPSAATRCTISALAAQPPRSCRQRRRYDCRPARNWQTMP